MNALIVLAALPFCPKSVSDSLDKTDSSEQSELERSVAARKHSLKHAATSLRVIINALIVLIYCSLAAVIML